MKYLQFRIIDSIEDVNKTATLAKMEMVPLLEDMTAEEIIQRILVVLPPPLPMLYVPERAEKGPIMEIPKEDTEARTANARKRDPWEDPNPEQTAERKKTMTEEDVMRGSRISAVDEEK